MCRGILIKNAPKIKSNYTGCKQFQSEEFIYEKKNSLHHGALMTQGYILDKPGLTQSLLTHRDNREVNILPTAFSCVVWKNLLLKNFIPQLLSVLKAKERRKR
jgi:hypothetical protein